MPPASLEAMRRREKSRNVDDGARRSRVAREYTPPSSHWIDSAMNDAIQRTLADLARALKKPRIPFAVIGGIAVAVRGTPRFTADVDIVAATDAEGAVALLQRLSETAFEPLFPHAEEVVRTAFIVPLRHRTTEVGVDIALGMTGFERDLIARAERVRFGRTTLPVATSEDLLLLKLIAGRPRDTDDARGIVARQASRLDWNYLRTTGAQLSRALDQDLLPELRRLRTMADAGDDS